MSAIINPDNNNLNYPELNLQETRETAYETNGTYYHHDEDNGNTFNVTAAERWSITMVKKLKEKFPDEVTITVINDDGSICAKMPKSWMRIVPKKHVEMSDERKEAMAERLKAAREAKNNKSS